MIFPSFGKWTKREKNRVKENRRRQRRQSFDQTHRLGSDRKMQLETLEDRRMLASDIDIIAGVLTVTDTSGGAGTVSDITMSVTGTVLTITDTTGLNAGGAIVNPSDISGPDPDGAGPLDGTTLVIDLTSVPTAATLTSAPSGLGAGATAATSLLAAGLPAIGADFVAADMVDLAGTTWAGVPFGPLPSVPLGAFPPTGTYGDLGLGIAGVIGGTSAIDAAGAMVLTAPAVGPNTTGAAVTLDATAGNAGNTAAAPGPFGLFTFTQGSLIDGTAIASISIDGGGMDDTVEILGNPLPTTIIGGAGDDTVDIDQHMEDYGGPIGVSLGGGAADALIVDDSAHGGVETYTVTSAAVGRTGSPGVTYSGVATLDLVLSVAGANLVDVTSTSSALNIIGGAAADTVDIDEHMEFYGGPIDVSLGVGADALIVDDSAHFGAETYMVTSSAVSRTGSPGVTYSGIETLDLVLGVSGPNLVDVTSTSSALNIIGGGAADTVDIDEHMESYGGPIDVSLGGGADTLIVDDSSHADFETYTISSTAVDRTGSPGVTYSGVEMLDVVLSSFDNTIDITSLGADTTVTGHPTSTSTDDTFNVAASSLNASDTLFLNGTDESSADVFNFDAEGVDVTLEIGVGLSIAGAPPIAFIDIETVNLIDVDDFVALGVDGASDEAFLTGNSTAGFNATLFVDGVLDGMIDPTVPQINLDAASATLDGRGGADRAQIDETIDGMPMFAGTALGAHANASFLADAPGPLNVGIAIIGGTGGDGIGLDVSVTGPTVRYYSDDDAAANSGNVAVDGAFALSFESLAPIDIIGGGGALVIDATSTPATTFLNIADDSTFAGPYDILINGGAAVAGDGVNAVWGDGGFETTRYTNFATVTVRGGTGSETISLGPAAGIDLDGAAGSPTTYNITGENTLGTDVAADTINIDETPAGVTVNAFGGGGADTINVGGDASLAPAIGSQLLDQFLGAPVNVDGGAGADVLNVDDFADLQNNNYVIYPTSVTRTNTGPPTPVVNYTTIEALNVQGGQGADKFVAELTPATAYSFNGQHQDNVGPGPSGAPYGSIPGDTLSVNNLDAVNNNPAQTMGSITTPGGGIANFADFEWVVLPDRFEMNDFANGFTTDGDPSPGIADLSTNLGSERTVILNNLSIHGPDDPATQNVEDTDFFKYTANVTGIVDISIHFEHEFGDLELRVFDSAGNQIVLSDVSTDATDLEKVTIPVVSQEMYYIQVRGVVAPGDDCNVNNYSLEVENHPAPVPTGIHLDPASDTGMMNNDNNTEDTTPTFFIQADLLNFVDSDNDGTADANITEPTILTAAQAAAGNVAGVGIEVTVVNSATGVAVVGYANPLPNAATPNIYSFTTAALADGVYFVSARTLVVDGQNTNVQDTTDPTHPLWITIDNTNPATPVAPDLLSVSDTGMFNNDNVTNKMALAVANPAGTNVEPNTKVFVFAGAEQVGQGVATTLGTWEVTTEPLADGNHNITVVLEDAAGNRSTPSLPLQVEVDKYKPNTPLLDVIDASDLGHSETDNITSVAMPIVTMTSHDPNAANHVLFADNYKFRIYDRFEGAQEVLIYDSAMDAGEDANTSLVGFEAGFTANLFITETLAALADGTHELKLEVEDRAGNISDDFLLTLEIDLIAPPATVDLLSTSDSGMSDTDNVTAINTPAFSGISEVGATVSVFATPMGGTPELIGVGAVGSDQSDVIAGGAINDDMGLWEVTVEPLDDGIYNIFTIIEDWAGNQTQSAGLQIEVDTIAPNTPLIDLAAPEDNGHHDTDNITNVPNPLLSLTTHDPNVHINPLNFKYRLYDRYDSNNEVLIYSTLAQLGDFTAATQAFTSVDTTNGTASTLALADGVHHLKLEVEDRAGNISHDFLLNLEVDTQAPVATIDLIDDADSGMFNDDNVTGIANPAFAGISEVQATVQIFATNVVTGVTQQVGVGEVGEDESDVPLGGTNVDDMGSWEVTIEPLDDGVYDFFSRITDWAGNVTNSAPVRVEIDLIEPNLPYLDLITDTGHSDKDNITSDNTPTVTMTTHDENDNLHQLLFTDNLKFRIYDRYEGQAEFLIYDSAQDAAEDAINTGGDMFTANTLITEILPVQYAGLFGDNPPAIAGGVLADGIHNLKLEVEDRAGNISHDFLLPIEIDTVTVPPTIDLIADADTGMFDDDNVTNIQELAFSGLAEINSLLRVFATNVVTGEIQLVGQGVTGSDLSDVLLAGQMLAGQVVAGLPDDGLGLWEITIEPLDDGVYDFIVESEDWAGNLDQSEPLRVEIDTYEPNLPFLDLIEASDSGRHDDDNVTFDNTPTVTMTSHDQNLAFHLLMFQDNFKFRIYDRFEGAQEVLLYDSAADAAEDATNFAGDMFTANLFITETLPMLADGTHNLKLEVEDRAGNISHDFLLDLLIDTVAPPVNIMTIAPNDDSGLDWMPATFGDNITNVTNPGFIGQSEANAIVRVYADSAQNNAIDFANAFFLTVANPLDGDENDNDVTDGQWEATFKYNLNDPNFFPLDGLREILVTGEDLAGNVSTPTDSANPLLDSIRDIFIDTRGPQVYDPVGAEGAVYYPIDFTYDVFDPKPSVDGPTPVVTEIRVNVQDLPNRDAAFLYDAIKTMTMQIMLPNGEMGFVLPAGAADLVGDFNGNIPIESVTYVPDPLVAGQVATGEIVLNFATPIPDDRFTLTINDLLTDPANNALDGEFNTDEPSDDHAFPSGDKVPGGDFVARFTVDTRPEIGVWAAGNIWVDTNGNMTWDPDNEDYTNRDIAYAMGFTTDDIFAGNFSGPGPDGILGNADDRGAAAGNAIADGFDKIGAYGFFSGQWRWLIDIDNDGTVDIDQTDTANVNGLPFAGNFDGFAANGDEVGLLDGSNDMWWFDTDHDYIVDTALATTMEGYPIIGDFDGDGAYDLGTWTDDTFQLDLAADGLDGNADPGLTFRFGFVGVRERPVAADFNADGFDDLGLWTPDRTGTTPGEGSEWYFLISGDLDATFDSDGDGNPTNDNSLVHRIRTDVRIGQNVIDYKPTPFGNDLYYQFGDSFGIPIVGNFDPPVTPSSVPNPYEGGNMHYNALNSFDVNADGVVSVADLRIVFAYQQANGAQRLMGAARSNPFLDVNRDGYASISDVRVEFAYLMSGPVVTAEAEGEGEADVDLAPVQVLAAPVPMEKLEIAPLTDDTLADLQLSDSELAYELPSAAPVEWADSADAVFIDEDDEFQTELEKALEDLMGDLLDLL